MQDISYVWVARLTHISVESDVPVVTGNCLSNTWSTLVWGAYEQVVYLCMQVHMHMCACACESLSITSDIKGWWGDGVVGDCPGNS